MSRQVGLGVSYLGGNVFDVLESLLYVVYVIGVFIEVVLHFVLVLFHSHLHSVVISHELLVFGFP